jgi:hypothetical protein
VCSCLRPSGSYDRLLICHYRSKISELCYILKSSISYLWFCPALWWRDSNIHLVFLCSFPDEPPYQRQLRFLLRLQAQEWKIEGCALFNQPTKLNRVHNSISVLKQKTRRLISINLQMWFKSHFLPTGLFAFYAVSLAASSQLKCKALQRNNWFSIASFCRRHYYLLLNGYVQTKGIITTEFIYLCNILVTTGMQKEFASISARKNCMHKEKNASWRMDTTGYKALLNLYSWKLAWNNVLSM